MQRYPTPPEPPTVVFAADRSGQDLGGRHDLVRVGRGAYMVRTPPGTPAWRVKELVTLARCEAVLRAVPSALSLTHEAVAVLQGLAALEAEPDIRVAVPSTRSRMSLPLPRLSYGSSDRPRPGRRVSLRRSLVAPAESEIHVVSGLLVTTPLRTALDCAFDLPVRESLPVIDAALRLVCRPDRFTRRCNGEMTLDTARARLVRMVEEQGGRNGKRRLAGTPSPSRRASARCGGRWRWPAFPIR